MHRLVARVTLVISFPVVLVYVPGSGARGDNDEVERLGSLLLHAVGLDKYGLQVPDDDPYLQAITRLTEIGTPEAVGALEEFLTTYGGNRSLKQHAVVALGRIGTEAAVEAIGRFEAWAGQLLTDPPPFRFGPMDHAMDHFTQGTLAPLAIDEDGDGTKWALFRWYRYGRTGYWLTEAEGEGTWSQPMLLDVPEAPREARAELSVAEGTVTLVLDGQAVQLKLADQLHDDDEDGLADLVESHLQTDPERADTDGDGVPDGEDTNPLTPKHETEDDVTEIRQAVFTVLFATCNSQDAIVVVDRPERGDFAGQEYHGFGGYVLRARDIRDGFVNVTDLGVTLKSPTEAEASIADYEGSLAASDHRAELRKVHGKWVVVDFRLGAIA